MIGTISNKIFLDRESFSLNDALNKAKKQIRDAFFEMISSIESHLDTTIKISVVDTNSGFVVNNEYAFKFSLYPCHGKRIYTFEAPQKLKLDLESFAFNLNKSQKSTLIVCMDDLIKVKNMTYESNKSIPFSATTAIFEKKNIELLFNNDFSLQHLKFSHVIHDVKNRKTKCIDFLKTDKMLMTFKEESFLWNFTNEYNKFHEEICPELYNHGAYDFKAKEFSDRLELLKMVNI